MGDTWRPLPNSATVFRMMRHDLPILDDDTATLNPKVFYLSDSDKAQDPPRLSVFDQAKTTHQQACRIRSIARGIAVCLLVKHVHGLHDHNLRVVRDELDPTHGPGADGHCGIIGFDQLPEESKKQYSRRRKLIASLLAEIAWSC